MHVHQKVDCATSLCNLLTSLNDCISQEEQLMKFEIQCNALSTTGLPMLKQMNLSICYDAIYIKKWNELITEHIDNINVGLCVREQESNTCQILFTSLIQDQQEISEVIVTLQITLNYLISVVDLALKANLCNKLYDVLNTFFCEAQNKVNVGQEQNMNVNNPIVTKHKGCYPKRFKSAVEETSSKSKNQLKVNTSLNVVNEGLGIGSSINEAIYNNKGHKCEKCKEYGYYAKTCNH
ncbi:21702_t:CDS:2 [Cetraspora pellucida]|uniref:21702_t:CDS:1 n=1 Tax=Cetraspora pellucida TaxID=1433469 RepID=A0A9N8WRV9_9GLOM|nr:21702_t:CDS:2 [Cetraspora pellucida]